MITKSRIRVKEFLLVIFLVIFVVYILLPIVLVVMGSFGKRWYGTILPEFFTLKWYVKLFQEFQYTRAMSMSLSIAFMCVVITFSIGLPAVYAIYDSESRLLQNVFDAIIIMPIAIPPLVMATGLIELYTFKNFTLVGTWVIILAAHVVYTIPFMLKPIMATLETIDWKTLNEAADSLGSSPLFKVRRVLIPNLLPGIISGSLMVFAMSLGEFQLAVMLAGFRTRTFPLLLREAFYMETGFSCAATTLLIAAALLSLTGVAFAMRKLGGSSREVLIS